MTNFNYHSETPEAAVIRDQVMRDYLENPLSLDDEAALAMRAWKAMTSAQREVRTAIYARLIPNDLALRQRAFQGMLLVECLEQRADDIITVKSFERQFSAAQHDQEIA